MHDMLETYAYSGRLSEVSASLKLLVVLGSVLICVSSPGPLAPMLIGITLAGSVVAWSRVPAGVFIRILLIPLSFALLSAIVVMLMGGTGETLFSFSLAGHGVAVRKGGADLGLLLLSRTFGGTCSMLFLALTTPMMEVFSILAACKMPQGLVELSMLIYRYIFVLLEEASLIHSAQNMRLGYAGLAGAIRSFSILGSVLFLRSWEKGEALITTMDARCYSGRLALATTMPISGPGLAAALAYLLVMASVAWLGREVTLI
ncbi:MAG: Energy-coupling factor transporter transmembrane protein EcfT [Methanosaeta sp. PtaU1.Bin028]|nr:MAG: Energy-coupling factor transporter transmembrane protein EcfT [Methanosaeta sp. PtaU1.Bin028]